MKIIFNKNYFNYFNIIYIYIYIFIYLLINLYIYLYIYIFINLLINLFIYLLINFYYLINLKPNHYFNFLLLSLSKKYNKNGNRRK